MCGIVGYIANHIDEITLRNMMDKIIHRGPDGSGLYVDPHIALGHRRLAIIDIDKGAQPMKNENGSLICIFNGEIYNYQELREDLIEKGHTFTTDSDTEVLLHGYEEWKKELPNKLRGMFAFAIWDRQNQELFCARDYFGIKPFYYYKKGNTFLFGSEIKSFLVHPDFEKKLNREQLELYLTYQYSPGNETFFENVWKLPPGHSMVVRIRDFQIEIQRYWKPAFAQKSCKSVFTQKSGNPFSSQKKTLDQWADDIEQVMIQSVKVHKISDVEVGSFLSSGIDSSYIAALSSVNKTFTVGFDNNRYNESALAHQFSQEIGVWNHTYLITPEEFWSHLPLIQYHMDEPLADASSIALYFLNREAARHVKVCLSGEGADELFAGYHIYKEPEMCKAYDALPLFFRKAIGGIAGLLPPMEGINFLVRHGKDRSERYIGNTCLFSEKQKKKLLKHYSGQKKPADLSTVLFKELENADDVTRMQYVDLHLWLNGDILLKADKMSMANSLELRVPFLDKEVFHIANRIPAEYKVTKMQTKIALRKAAERTIGNRTSVRKKLGFPVPIRDWLREEPYVSIVRDSFQSAAAREFFHTGYLLHLLNLHASRQKDCWREIWCVYMFLVWYGVYFEDARI